MTRRAVVSIATLATLATAMTMLVPAGAAPGTPYQDTAFGTDPAGNPALSNVVSLTAGPYGVDIATSAGPVHMTSAGEVAYAPAMSGLTGFATDAQDRGFVTQSGQDALTVLDRLGNVTKSFPLSQFTGPTLVVVEPSAPDNDGHELVWLATPSGLEALDPSVTNTTDADAAEFAFVDLNGSGGFAIAPDHSFVVAASEGSSKLSHYSRQGVYLGDIVVHDSYGNVVVATGPPSFDGSGTMFIPDGHHVVEATLDGTYLGVFGQSDQHTDAPHPPDVGQLDGVAATAVDCRGRVMVLDGNPANSLRRVVRYSGIGTSPFPCPADPPVTSVKATGFGSSIGVDRAAQVYVGGNGIVGKFDASGHRIGTIGTAGATPGQDGGLGFVFGVAVSDSGEVFAASNEYVDSNGNILTQQDPKIVEFHSAGGHYVHQWRSFVEPNPAAPGTTMTTAFVTPGNLLIRPTDKHLFVLDFGLHRLLEFTQSMTFVRSFVLTTIPGSLSNTPTFPTAFGFRSDGSVLIGVRQRAASWTPTNQTWVSSVEHFSTAGADLGDGWSGPTLDGSQSFVDGWIITRPDGTMLWPVSSNLPTGGNLASSGLLQMDAQGHIIRRMLEGALSAGVVPLLAPDCQGNLVADDNYAETYRVIHYAAGKCVWLPTASTGLMTKHTTTSVTVTGSSNPSDQVTKMRVLYGATTAYGKATAWVTLPCDNTVQTRTFALTGLLSAHTYHYRVQVQNGSGTVSGVDRIAKTL
ncbi:MAG: hypothetical protein QOD07_2822 [Frankiaceae bacterium]|jgi:hypothetical protein|nr:hypothetical protein [Frankiaceae bacterium]